MSLNVEREIAPQGELQPKPSTLYSATQAFEKPIYETALAASSIGEFISPGLSSPEFRRGMADKIDVINNNLSDPRLGLAQRGFNEVSSIVGSIAPTAPLGFAGGLVGRFAMGAAGMAARGVASEAFINLAQKPLSQMVAGNYAKYFPLIGEASLAGTAKAAVESYSAYKGFVIPEHIAENYHKENDTLNVHQAIKDWSADNYGFLIPTASIAAGYIAFKAARIPGIKRADMAKFRAEQQAHLNTKSNPLSPVQETNFEKSLYNAVKDGKITQAEHDWYLQYLDNPADHEGLMQSSKKVLDEARIPHDGNGNHWFEILSNEDVSNLKAAVADQSSTYFSGSDASTLTDYVVHNRMDAMRTMMAENPNIVDALRGYSDHIENKFGMREKHFSELDSILKENLPKGLGSKELFSQSNIYSHLKKQRVEAYEVPYHVPSNIAYKLKLANRLSKLKKGTDEYNLLKQQIDAVPVLKPVDELEHIANQLFKDKSEYLYRGYDRKIFDFRRFPDPELGKGVWYTDNELYAKEHGKQLKKIYNDFKVFDVDATKDAELKSLYDKLHNDTRILFKWGQIKFKKGSEHEARLKEIKATIKNTQKEFLDAVKAKGYEGIKRKQGIADAYGSWNDTENGFRERKSQVMFFEAPKGSNNFKIELVKNFKKKAAYQRLQELSEIWANAKHLLNRINMESNYDKQEAFNKILKHFLDMVDSNAQRLANPAKVTDYIKRRVEDATPFVPESRIENDIVNDEVRNSFEGKETKREGETKVVDKEKTHMLFDSMRKQIEDYGSDSDKEEFSFIEQRYNQLKDNEDALSKLVECALGGING
jgi:hypothetical protein